MSEDHQPVRFVEQRNIPFGTDAGLFAWFFEAEEFIQWHRKGRSWQLRCLGAPGSGKTTLSALVVNRLKDEYRGRNSAVASIFLRDVVQDEGDGFLDQFLKSILHQLSTTTPSAEDMTAKSCQTVQTAVAKSDGQHGYDPLRQALYARISQLDRALLIIDDLDLCSRMATVKVETELSMLQLHGLSILVTSRLPHKHHSTTACCDVQLNDWEHDSRDISVYWSCRDCYGDTDDFDGANAYILCQSCVDGKKVCKQCGQLTNLYEPYRHVDFVVSVPDESMRGFIAREIELTHGDVGLSTYSKLDRRQLPPPSALGRLLTPTATSLPFLDLLNRIVASASANVLLAKLRLDTIESAQTISDLFRLGDRLPDNILAIFDAGVARISSQPTPQRNLGLRAIVRAASKYEGIPFAALEQDLHRDALLDSTASSCSGPLPRYEPEEVLHAACGFLISDMGNDNIISTYDKTFYKYVEENYNETLFWVKSETMIGLLSRSSTAYVGKQIGSGSSAVRMKHENHVTQVNDFGGFGLGITGTEISLVKPEIETRPVVQWLNMKARNITLGSEIRAKRIDARHPNDDGHMFSLARRPTSHI